MNKYWIYTNERIQVMSYQFREVKCPWCDHVFMWTKDRREGLIIHWQKLKKTGEFVEEAKCPKCASKMIVWEHILEGIDFDDERVEKIDGINEIWAQC